MIYLFDATTIKLVHVTETVTDMEEKLEINQGSLSRYLSSSKNPRKIKGHYVADFNMNPTLEITNFKHLLSEAANHQKLKL